MLSLDYEFPQFEETVAKLATKDDIRNMATRDNISGLVTEAEV